MTGWPLPELCFLVVGLLLLFYVILDGADLGIGILALFSRDEGLRGLMMGSVAGVWHANQTWLVIVGGLLFGAFPLAFGVVFSALYVPCMLLLLSLIARGAAFEFRAESHRKGGWSALFGLGSLSSALAQGLALGGFLQGFRVEADHFAGGLWDWWSPLCAATAAGVTLTYVLLGATWLVAKTEGELQTRCRRAARWALAGTAGSAAAASALAFRDVPYLADAWTYRPGGFGFWGAWALACAVAVLLLRSLGRPSEHAPFRWAALAVTLGFAGLVSGVFPLAIPPDLTLEQAAAPPNTLKAMLAVVGFLIPFLVLQNALQFRVFRGKTSAAEYEG